MRRYCIYYLFFIFLFYGCAAPIKNYHHSLIEQANNIDKVCIIPDIKVYQINAGGVKEYRDDYTQIAKQNIQKAIKCQVNRCLKAELVSLPDNIDQETKEKIRELALFYWYINLGINFQRSLRHIDQQQAINSFNYPDLNELYYLRDVVDTDVFLLVWGQDNVSTGGRIALQFAAVILGAAAGVQVNPQLGISVLNLSLIELSSGKLLWRSGRFAQGSYDFRKQSSVNSLVSVLFNNFPVKE